MGRALRWQWTLVVLSLVVAGCSSRAPPPPVSETGTLLGQVMDESESPLPGVTVQVLLTELQARTDENGAYEIVNVPAGNVRVVASRIGYSSSTLDGNLSAPTLRLDFVLTAVPGPDPYHATIPFSGQISCGLPGGVHCGQAGPPPNTTHHFEVDSGLKGMIVEAEWMAPASGLSAELTIDVIAATRTACGTKYAGAHGPAPLRYEVPAGYPISGGHQCIVVRPGNETVTAEQTYALWVTLFYHEPPPPGFSFRAP